jgi:hypothetical protein
LISFLALGREYTFLLFFTLVAGLITQALLNFILRPGTVIYYSHTLYYCKEKLLALPKDNIAVFLAQSRFSRLRGTPELFRISGGCRTRASCSHSALKQLRRPAMVPLPRDCGIPVNAQAPPAKTGIRSKSRQYYL